MRVDHRGAHVPGAQPLLDRPNIIPVLQQAGCKGMAKRVATGRLGDPGVQSGCLYGMLWHRLAQVMMTPLARAMVDRDSRGGLSAGFCVPRRRGVLCVRTCSRWAFSRGMTDAGSTVTQSLSALPSRTRTSPRVASMAWTMRGPQTQALYQSLAR